MRWPIFLEDTPRISIRLPSNSMAFNHSGFSISTDIPSTHAFDMVVLVKTTGFGLVSPCPRAWSLRLLSPRDQTGDGGLMLWVTLVLAVSVSTFDPCKHLPPDDWELWSDRRAVEHRARAVAARVCTARASSGHPHWCATTRVVLWNGTTHRDFLCHQDAVHGCRLHRECIFSEDTDNIGHHEATVRDVSWYEWMIALCK